MRIAYHIRPGYTKNIAGDSIQMLKTKEYIEKQGAEIDIITDYDHDLSSYDIIHLFNTTRVSETYKFFLNAFHQHKKIVVSPIFIDMNKVYTEEKDVYKLMQWKSMDYYRKQIYINSDILLPNSESEMQWIKNELDIKDLKYHVIYNGVDKEYFEQNNVNKKHCNLILCIGRISEIKNQLYLIRAVKKLNLPLLLIGPVNSKDYAIKCFNEGKDIIKYIPYVEHNKVIEYYRAARVHVQPSKFETAGLTSLEAAAAGCGIVITEKGGTHDYFKNYATYCDPFSVDSIVSAILQEFGKKNNDILKNFIKENYTWERAANETYKVYKELI